MQLGGTCTGCGRCCQEEACALSVEYMHSEQAPCVALEIHDGILRCGLVLHPHKYLLGPEKPWADEMLSPLFRLALGIGKGCDSVLVASERTVN